MLWMENGGKITLDRFRELSSEDREAIVDYLGDFIVADEVKIGNKLFKLVHAGFSLFEENKHIYDYLPEEVIFARPSFENPYYKDKNTFVVCGHTPTQLLSGKAEIFKLNNSICIDCGATFGGKLACLRLDDMEEFYI